MWLLWVSGFSYLHTVIVLISHNDSSLTVTRNSGWTIKLTRPRTQRAKLMVEGTTRLEYLEREGTKTLLIDLMLQQWSPHYVPTVQSSSPINLHAKCNGQTRLYFCVVFKDCRLSARLFASTLTHTPLMSSPSKAIHK